MYSILFDLVVAVAGGVLRRIIGGGWPVIPWGIPRLLFGVPFCGLLAGLGGHPWLWVLSYLSADVGIRLGHAQYQSLGFGPPGKRGASLDWLVTLFFGPDRDAGTRASFWRCVFGLSLTGLGVTCGPGLLYALYVDPVAGALLAVAGALKPLGYIVGWKIWNSCPACSRSPNALTPNVYGEFWTGFVMWGAVACIV